MGKLGCWAIIAVLILHMSIYSMDSTNENIDFDTEVSQDVSQTSARQSSSLQGNESGGNSGCNFTNIADGMGGPIWESTASYNLHDIVEWPAGSGHFWQSTTAGPTSEPNSTGKWIGPCSCEEIAESSGIQWNSTVAYNAWQILEYNGGIWFVLDAGTNAGDLPNETLDTWALCKESCASLVNVPTPVWENSTIVAEGEVYEYPANSGHYYTVVGVGMSNQTVGAPGVDLDAWGTPLECDCKEIWADSGQPHWDSSIHYFQNAVVEWPAGSNTLYISFDHGIDVEPGSANGSYLWNLCSGNGPSDYLCDDFNGTGGKTWMNSTYVSAGEIYQYPDNSGMFYIVSPGISAQIVGAPGTDFDAWSEKACTCEEIWKSGGQVVWDSTTTYNSGVIVEHPANSEAYWMAIMPSTTAGVEPGEPWADGNEWELCNSGDEHSSNSCAGLNVVGVWDSSMNVTSGEVYEYPAGSEMYYQVNPGSPFWSVNAPDMDMDVWSPIECPCKETWVANGQPVWTSGTAYPGNYVVEHPAGTGNLYIPLESGGVSVGGGEPGIDAHWVLCEGQGPSTSPCEGLNVPVWNASTPATVGDIYEYPSNSDVYYEVTYVDSNGLIATAPGEAQDYEFWTPYICQCKETWVANGQPVWVSGTAYPGNYVVEHPAGTGNLYIPLESGGVSVGGGEPGIDVHWVLCDGQGPSPGPCEGLSVPVWNASTPATVGDIYEYPSNSGIYYEVTYVDPNGLIATAPGEAQDDEFWAPYICPCKETWVANGQPVWNNSTSFYVGNYVVEWPAGSGMLYLAEAGGITGAGEPGIDGHWIPCESNDLQPETVPDASLDSEGLPSIGALATLLGLVAASAFVRREYN